MTLLRYHATAFLDKAMSAPIKALREQWDPVMAGQIDAHVSLMWPEEIPDHKELVRRARSAAAFVPPILVTITTPFYVGNPKDGVFFKVIDAESGIANFRSKAAPIEGAIDFPPHVTIVHPRTSALGCEAWQRLEGLRLDISTVLTEVSITAFDGTRWLTVEQFQFGSAS
jgi:hypothetical protein